MIARKIKELRLESDMSQQELADKLYVSRQTVSRWESGKTIPTMDNLIELSIFFEVNLNFFLQKTFSETPIDRKYRIKDLCVDFFNQYRIDMTIISLSILPIFYILLVPLSYVGLYYSFKKRKKYTVILAIIVLTLTIYFSLEMVTIIRHIFGIGGSTTEFFMD